MYREIPRLGTRSTNRWYLSYHSAVFVVPQCGTCRTKEWYDKYQRVALQIPKGETDAEVRSFPRYPPSFIFLPPYHCAFSSVCFFFSYSAAIRKCTECPKTDTLLFALTLVFNDLCFWHGFGKYKGEESQAVRLRNRTAAT